MILYLLFFMTASGVVVIALDPGDPEVMRRPPRDPKLPITNRAAITAWVIYAVVLFLAALGPLVLGPDDPSPDVASISMTMTFVVMGLGTVFNALTNRREPASGLDAPVLQALLISLFPLLMLALATELPGLQRGLLTESLSGRQWCVCLGLAALLPLTIEARKWLLRRRMPPADVAVDVRAAVDPGRADTGGLT